MLSAVGWRRQSDTRGFVDEDTLARTAESVLSGGLALLDIVGLDDLEHTAGRQRRRASEDAIGAVLVRSLEEGELAVPVGGGRFAVLIPTATATQALDRVRQIVDVLGRQLPDRPEARQALAGLAFARLRSFDHAWRRARVALDRAHADPRAVVVADEDDLDFEQALADGQFHLVYQPTFWLHGGALHGFEALVRWTHPTLGPVRPDQFIPAAEESGQILPLGRWVLHEALRQLAVWTRSLPEVAGVTMAVNLAPPQLLDPNLVADIAGALSETGIEPHRLCLEVTEGAVVADATRAAAVLAELRALGVSIAIDDYGSGNASISYLRRFPADKLKIDKSLVDGLLTDDGVSMAFVQSITDLAAILGMTTVAEGIETRDQLLALAGLGCAIGQGFYLSRGLDARAATSFLFDLAHAREPAAA